MTADAKARVRRMNLVFALASVVFFIALSALQFLAGNTGVGWFIAGLGAASVVSSPFLSRRATERARLRFGDGTFEIRSGISTQRFTAAEASQVVSADSVALGLTPAAPLLMLVGATKRIAMLSGVVWNPEQLGALALDLENRGVPLLSYSQRLTAAQLRAIDRRWMRVWEAHPIAVGLLAGLAAMLLISAVVLVALAILR